MPFIPHSPPFGSMLKPKLPPPEFDRTQAALATTTALAEAAAPATVAIPNYLAPTGVDQSAAIQAKLNAAGADDIVRLYGTYTIASTVVIKGNLDASGAVFNYTGTGVAVQVGDATVRSWKQIHLPRVVYTAKPATGWTAGTVGAKVVNIQSSRLFVPHVQGFETGLLMFAADQGVVYNTLTIGHLHNNKKNLGFDSASTVGWTNQNLFLGGRFSHTPTEGTDVAGSAHVWSGSNYGANNNTFLNCSFETAGTAAYQVDFEKALYNQFINCRWEATSGTPKVRWGALATLNRIVGGYDVNMIVETRVAGSARNIVDSSVGSRIFTGGATAGVVCENTFSNGSPVFTIVEAGADNALMDPLTAYRMRFSALDAQFKATADAYARARFETTTGRLYFGTGVTAATAYIDGTSATVRIGSGALIFGTDNGQDIGVAPASGRPRYVRVATAVQTGTFTTAARPAAATAGAGAMIFDTTLGKPVWSDGTNWKDATGATV